MSSALMRRTPRLPTGRPTMRTVRPATRLRVQAFKVTFKTPTGVKEVDCDADTYILDAAEAAGLDLPYSCRAGACSTCCGKVTEGTLDQGDQSFLDEAQQTAGFALICVSYPTSNLSITTHQEECLT